MSEAQQVMLSQEQQARGSTNKWIIFSIVAIGVLMSTLDSSIVNISLPAIARDFSVPLNGAIEWVAIAYLVTTAALLLSAGRLADMIGLKSIWIIGLIIFTGSSILCGAASTLWFLIAMRALQGVGSALLSAASPALLTAAFPPQERGRALGFNAITVAVGTSVGPTLGGFITATFSWRGIFYVNVPLGIVGIILTAWLLRKQSLHQVGKFDPLGAFLLGIGLAALTIALSFSSEFGLTSPLILGLFVLGAIALVSLPLFERRVSNPILPRSLLNNPIFLAANISLALSFLALFAVSFLMPFYLEQLHHYPAQIAGLLLTPLPIMIAIVAPLSGSLADKLKDSRWLSASGLFIACLGLVLLGFLDAHSSAWDIVWRLLLVGGGQALFQAPNNSTLMGAAPVHVRGSASGIMATSRVIGQSLSIALAGAIFTGLGGALAGTMLLHTLPGQRMLALEQTFLLGFRAALFVCAAIALIGVITSLTRKRAALTR